MSNFNPAVFYGEGPWVSFDTTALLPLIVTDNLETGSSIATANLKGVIANALSTLNSCASTYGLSIKNITDNIFDDIGSQFRKDQSLVPALLGGVTVTVTLAIGDEGQSFVISVRLEFTAPPFNAPAITRHFIYNEVNAVAGYCIGIGTYGNATEQPSV